MAAAGDVTQLSSAKMFGGFHRRYTHESTECGCKMTFAVYFPPQAETAKVPVRACGPRGTHARVRAFADVELARRSLCRCVRR